MRARGDMPSVPSTVNRAHQEVQMPSVSKETAPTKVSWKGVDIDHADLEGGYAVCFERHTADADLAPLFRGLPEDRAQLPRWGYVIEGRIGFRFADREETYEAGEAYYAGADHTPVHYAGTEIVEFSPTEILNETIPVVLRNLDANGIAVEMSQAGEPAAVGRP
jgi:hypothetical protein